MTYSICLHKVRVISTIYAHFCLNQSSGYFSFWLLVMCIKNFGVYGWKRRDLFDINFVIKGKVISLHKVIKYEKRTKSIFDDFSAKHMTCEPLTSLKFQFNRNKLSINNIWRCSRTWQQVLVTRVLNYYLIFNKRVYFIRLGLSR